VRSGRSEFRHTVTVKRVTPQPRRARSEPLHRSQIARSSAVPLSLRELPGRRPVSVGAELCYSGRIMTMHSPRLSRAAALCLVGLVSAALGVVTSLPRAAAQPGTGFTNFETEPVRPLALSADGRTLYALNTADDRLEIFRVTDAGLERAGEVTVGLRPVALTVRAPGEIWVSNHLSDSVSVVDAADPARARVVRTLQVGDEPRDILTAGPGHDRVFVATARRADTLKAGVGRANVWVFDAGAPEAAPQVVTLFGTSPRALAVSPDGRTVYAAIFRSGNGTTVVDREAVASVDPATPVPGEGFPRPEVSRIVRWYAASGVWVDEALHQWTAAVPFTLPDHDVFVIDAAAEAPAVVGAVAGVGTVLFNMAVQPGTGEVWVTNTDARNIVRFETKQRGHATDSRVTRLRPDGQALTARHVPLNPHVDYSRSPGPPDEVRLSLAQPLEVVFRSDGSGAFVAAFGSRKVGVLGADGAVLDRIDVGFGPAGLALDEARDRLYVLNHLDASLSIVDLARRRAVATVPLAFDPTPRVVHEGRPFLYDAALTSGHGDMACASCHMFADTDRLAWDLGDPGGAVQDIPFGLTHEDFRLKPRAFKQHPLKGPMATQSLRGLAGAAPYHWRGDRFGPEDDPAADMASFKKFLPAFVGLNGRAETLTEAEMEAYGAFLFTIRYPPNPHQPLDRSLSPEAQAGADLFSSATELVDSGVASCADCHKLPLGTNGRINFEGDRSGQDFKAPQLRGLYDKVGRFDVAGPQVSGFGFGHDGDTGTLIDLLRSEVFTFPGGNVLEEEARRHEVGAFLIAFDTGMAPAVGRQLTAGAVALGADERSTLEQVAGRARAGDCDLVARARLGTDERGWLLEGEAFAADVAQEAPASLDELVALAPAAGGVTFTCVPPGDGRRSALDRDGDGHRNGDERASGSDPTDPGSWPGHIPTPSPTAPAPSATPAAPPATPTSSSEPPHFAVYLPAAER